MHMFNDIDILTEEVSDAVSSCHNYSMFWWSSITTREPTRTKAGVDREVRLTNVHLQFPKSRQRVGSRFPTEQLRPGPMWLRILYVIFKTPNLQEMNLSEPSTACV